MRAYLENIVGAPTPAEIWTEMAMCYPPGFEPEDYETFIAWGPEYYSEILAFAEERLKGDVGNSILTNTVGSTF